MYDSSTTPRTSSTEKFNSSSSAWVTFGEGLKIAKESKGSQFFHILLPKTNKSIASGGILIGTVFQFLPSNCSIIKCIINSICTDRSSTHLKWIDLFSSVV